MHCHALVQGLNGQTTFVDQASHPRHDQASHPRHDYAYANAPGSQCMSPSWEEPARKLRRQECLINLPPLLSPQHNSTPQPLSQLMVVHASVGLPWEPCKLPRRELLTPGKNSNQGGHCPTLAFMSSRAMGKPWLQAQPCGYIAMHRVLAFA